MVAMVSTLNEALLRVYVTVVTTPPLFFYDAAHERVGRAEGMTVIILAIGLDIHTTQPLTRNETAR
jgi:hypothetical protein